MHEIAYSARPFNYRHDLSSWCDPVDAYEGTGERVYGGQAGGWQRTQASPPHAWAASSITEAVLATMRWASASLPCSRRKACKQPSCARIAGARSPCTAVLVDDRGERRRCCDHAIFSHPGLSLASGAAAVGEGLRRMQKIAGGMVGVTLGADGFLWLDAGHEQRARPPRVVVVDTLAAGDVFMPRSHWRSANDARSPMPLRSSERCPIPRAGYANGLRARAALKR